MTQKLLLEIVFFRNTSFSLYFGEVCFLASSPIGQMSFAVPVTKFALEQHFLMSWRLLWFTKFRE